MWLEYIAFASVEQGDRVRPGGETDEDAPTTAFSPDEPYFWPSGPLLPFPGAAFPGVPAFPR